jgi:ureidoacrylate peracid hydrolase
MVKLTYEKAITALLVIDPYNDFIYDGGKIWHRVKAVAEATNTIHNMLRVLTTARKAGASRLLCNASSLSPGRL